jgi:hypothetical protein
MGREIKSVANLTRRDGEEFEIALKAPVKTEITYTLGKSK